MLNDGLAVTEMWSLLVIAYDVVKRIYAVKVIIRIFVAQKADVFTSAGCYRDSNRYLVVSSPISVIVRSSKFIPVNVVPVASNVKGKGIVAIARVVAVGPFVEKLVILDEALLGKLKLKFPGDTKSVLKVLFLRLFRLDPASRSDFIGIDKLAVEDNLFFIITMRFDGKCCRTSGS